MKIYLESLGCRLNAAEIEMLARRFVGAGCVVVNTPAAADVIVLNSCAVTATAVRKSRHRLRTLHRRSPQARLAVIGCWATEDAAQAAEIPGVVWVLPNVDKVRTVEIITGKHVDPVPWSPGRWGHTRAFLAVQDGCDHTCTYCITRVLRGPAHSRPLSEVVADVRSLVAHGAKEVVLTGVSLGAYGKSPDITSGLSVLVETILQETALARLRLSSVEPWDVDERLLALLQNPRFCRQLHLPLQAGVDSVLKRMGRRITTSQFKQLVAAARAVSPDVAITTDIIAGFPGETEADFLDGLDFVRQMAFARLHVFPYSDRAGTAATRLPDQISHPVRRERAAKMRALGRTLQGAYTKRFIGETLPVLWEHQDKKGQWHGLTDNYLAVVVSGSHLYNQIVPTRLVAVEGNVIFGAVVP